MKHQKMAIGVELGYSQATTLAKVLRGILDSQIAHGGTSRQSHPVFRQVSSGIVISPMEDRLVLEELQAIVRFFFPRQTSDYAVMDDESFRAIVLAGQEEINRRDIGRRLAKDRFHVLTDVMESQRILIQTGVYLRATRPSNASPQDHIGWHRESFYGADMAYSVNFWLPIADVSAENALQYIPNSHMIPDEEIVLEQESAEGVERYSIGHKIGLLYAPKRIRSGVDLSNPKPFCVLPGEVAIFAGALIHGAAENRSDQIRFSLDFRLVAEENVHAERPHFATGKSYFEPL